MSVTVPCAMGCSLVVGFSMSMLIFSGRMARETGPNVSPQISIVPKGSTVARTFSSVWEATAVPSNRLICPMKSATKRLFGSSYSSSGVAIWRTVPPSITAIRLAMERASDWSWVTIIKVMPTVFWSRTSSICMASRNFASRAERGSSSKRTLGRFTNARARATRWR